MWESSCRGDDFTFARTDSELNKIKPNMCEWSGAMARCAELSEAEDETFRKLRSWAELQDAPSKPRVERLKDGQQRSHDEGETQLR